jgi:predicted DNA-binding WGR domain protein
MFPMTVVKRSGRAVTKDYHLILIRTADGRALHINRWGKKAQWGKGWKCEYFPDAIDAKTAFDKKYREKLDREYSDIFVNKDNLVNDEAELRKLLGPQLLASIGAANWVALIPGADVSGMKSGQHEAEWDERAGRYTERSPKLLADVPEPVEPIEERIATNPNWGIWG